MIRQYEGTDTHNPKTFTEDLQTQQEQEESKQTDNMENEIITGLFAQETQIKKEINQTTTQTQNTNNTIMKNENNNITEENFKENTTTETSK